jgi:hypothetical protein
VSNLITTSKSRCPVEEVMQRLVVILSLMALALVALPVGAGAQTVPPTPPRDQWYAQNDAQNGKGHWSNGARVRIDESCKDLAAQEQVACSLEAFKNKPFTVIAFVDSGINPYHHDFRAPDFQHHPSEFVEGFPADTRALNLSFDVADSQGYAAAREADDELWQEVEANKLYWIPGTRIIGGYSTRAGGAGAYPERKIMDENGHGTGVASVAAGQYFGSNPNALIVMVEGLGDASLDWAASQPWIDIVSNSWGNIGNAPLGSTRATKAATQRGQTIAFAAGNGATNTNSSCLMTVPCVPVVGRPAGVPSVPLPVEDPCKCKTPDSNPSVTTPYGASWILSVGAVSPINGQAHWWHSVPVDVSSFGSKWRAAAHDGVTLQHNRDFGGTSCATPVTAGVLSNFIERARNEFGDVVAGQREGQVVAVSSNGAPLPANGPLADGKLTRAEAEAIVQKTAFPVAADPQKIAWDYAIRPTTQAYYVYQGYGVVDRTSQALGMKVLMGEQAMPVRTEVDQWLSVVDAMRDALWNR